MPDRGQAGFTAALRQLYDLLTANRRRQFYQVLAFMLLGAAAEFLLVASALPFLALLGGSFDARSLGPLGRLAGLASEPTLGSVAPIFITAVIAASGIRLALSWASQRFLLGVGHDLTVEAHRRILLQPYAFHVERSTSESIAALEKIQLLTFGVLQQLTSTLVAVVVGLSIMLLLVTIDAAAALLAAAVLGLAYWLVSRLTAARLARHSAVVGTAYDARIRMIQESLGGIRDLIIDQTQAVYLDEFRAIDGRLARAQAEMRFIAASPRFLLEGAALVCVAALAMVLSDGDGGLGSALPILGAIALGGLRLMPLVQQAFASWATLAANRSVVGQVLDVLSLPVPEPSPGAARLPFAEAVSLHEVSYTYPTRSSPAVDRVSLEIRRGEHVALAGETGSGKSTLADLLMGLARPQSGSVTVDGNLLTPANVGAWRANIAHVSQGIFLADASIARNIAFSVAEDRIDMDRVRQAAAQAEIAAFIESLPAGYDTIVGERGVRLSGGQRQRIAVARALYKDATVLVLDEATNALDPDTEAKILGNLFSDKGRTVLVIAHRPSALAACDRVIRLRDGRIVEAVQAEARSQ